MKTTLKKIKALHPCEEGWEKLLKSLNKTQADDEELSLLHILESNGPADCIWAFRDVDGYKREMRLFAVWCARQVQHLMEDQRSIDAIDVAERFANGLATQQELDVARDAAWAAARSAAGYAAWDAQSIELKRMLTCIENGVDPYPVFNK